MSSRLGFTLLVFFHFLGLATAQNCLFIGPEQLHQLQQKAGSSKMNHFSLIGVEGNIVVMNYSGPLDSMEVAGTQSLNLSLRQELMTTFYQHMADVFDVVTLTSDFSYIGGGLEGFNILLKKQPKVNVDIFLSRWRMQQPNIS